MERMLYVSSNLKYNPHQIATLKCFSSRLAVGYAQSIEARYQVKTEDVVGAALKDDASTASEWSTIFLHT